MRLESGAGRSIMPHRSLVDSTIMFGRKIKKGYESDATRMIRERLQQKPDVVEEQRTARAMWWDRRLDLDQLRRMRESRVPQKGYVYQTDG